MTKSHFSVQGYFEELYEYERPEFLGTRRVDWPDRPLGSPGTIDIVITEDITVKRGAKERTYKASSKKPLKCRATLQMLCGRVLEVGNSVKVLAPDGVIPVTGTIESFDDDGKVTVKSDVTFRVEGWRLQLI